MKKDKPNQIICVKNRDGLEVGISINKEYTILERTNRYYTIKNDFGVITRYPKFFFKYTNQKV